jgi:hypothetical protein
MAASAKGKKAPSAERLRTSARAGKDLRRVLKLAAKGDDDAIRAWFRRLVDRDPERAAKAILEMLRYIHDTKH